MILTLDIGNTTIGIYGVNRTEDGGYQVIFSESLPTSRKPADYLPLLKRPFARTGIALSDIEGVALSSVVPTLNEPISRAVKALFGKAPVEAAADTSGLTFAIPHPERVGADRIVDAAWARHNYALPAVTVDLGTATTFNVLDASGVFLGGVIAPGLETGIRALSDRTAQLPEVDLHGPVWLIGRNTQECMRSGAAAGTAAMIDGLTARFEAQLGQPVSLALTGGWSRLVTQLCIHLHVCDPWMLPKGLALLYDQAAAKSKG